MTDHLAPEVLARVAEQGAVDLASRQRGHLDACRECQDAVIEAAGTTREFQTTTERPSSRDGVAATILRRTVVRRRRRRPWVLTAAIPMAAALAIMLVTPQMQSVTPSPALTAPIGEILADRDAGAMVFPGVAIGNGADAARRGGSPDNEILTSVEALAAEYRDDPDDPAVAAWLVAGYLALDDLAAAGTFATDALDRHPHDGRLLAAAGIVAYRSGHPQRARDLVQAAIDVGHDTPATWLNLAIVKLATGDVASATATLRRLERRGPSPVAERAAAILVRLDSH